MIRTPLKSRHKTPRAQTAEVRSVPAPLGGWNARDPLANMAPDDAIALDNWFPGTSFVELRGGYASHATGMTGAGKTLMVYNRMNGTNELWCTTSSGTYDVSSAGAVGASALARTNGKHQWTMFGDGTDNWLIACNGVDNPAYYDGTTWQAVTGATSPSLSGPTLTDLIGVNVFKGRLFFIEQNTLSFWYLSSGAAGGSLTEFDLSGEAPRGGYLLAMATWTRDAGDGIDDYAVFITSEGEAIVYQGTDPSTAANWVKVGSYYLGGKPLGRRPVTRYGGDVIVITEHGTLTLSTALVSAAIDQKLALSYKIEDAFTAATRQYRDIFGWEAIVFPAQTALLVNIPIVEDGAHEQYVMNTITRSWCRFTDWDAETFAVFNNELYFVDDTAVYKAWTGKIDDSDDIAGYAKQAFQYFGEKSVLKHFTLFRPILTVNGTFDYLADIDVDFRDDPITGTASYTTTTGAVWDVGKWDEDAWGASGDVVRQWTTPAEYLGFCVAGKVKVATNSLTIQWTSSDYVFIKGGILA